MSADRTNVASSGVAKVELTGAGRRPLDEELNRSVGDRCCGSLCVSRRNREGSKTVDMLSLSAERLLRCRQNTQVSIILEEGFDHPGDGRCKMLAVVDDQQKSLVVQRGRKSPDGTIRGRRHLQARDNCRPHEVVFGNLRHLCQEDATDRRQTVPNLDSQPRLSNATWPSNGHQSAVSDEPLHVA